MDKTVVDYFRCPDTLGHFETTSDLSANEGFFSFGNDTICYGRCSGATPARDVGNRLLDLVDEVQCDTGRIRLPFDLSEIVENLRDERYSMNSRHALGKITHGKASRRLYYFLRPLLLVGIRKHLQKVHLRGWERIAFPHWPVDSR